MSLQSCCGPFFLQWSNIMFLINGNILTPIWQPLCVLTDTHILLCSSNKDKIFCWILSPNKMLLGCLGNCFSSVVSRAICCVKTATTDHRYDTVLHVSFHDLTCSLCVSKHNKMGSYLWSSLFLLLYLCSHVDAAFDLKADDYKRKGISPVGVS